MRATRRELQRPGLVTYEQIKRWIKRSHELREKKEILCFSSPMKERDMGKEPEGLDVLFPMSEEMVILVTGANGPITKIPECLRKLVFDVEELVPGEKLKRILGKGNEENVGVEVVLAQHAFFDVTKRICDLTEEKARKSANGLVCGPPERLTKKEMEFEKKKAEGKLREATEKLRDRALTSEAVDAAFVDVFVEPFDGAWVVR